MYRRTAGSANRRDPEVADAVRPRIVCEQAYAVAHSFLRRQKQTMVITRSAIIQYCNAGVVLTLSGILQVQATPLIRICRCRTRCESLSVDRTRAESEK